MNFFGIPELDQLVYCFSRFPSIGPKSARRIAFHILQDSGDNVFQLAEVIQKVKSTIGFCEKCRHISVKKECHICENTERNHKILCVVSQIQDLISIESSNIFQGIYFVLNGNVSPIKGIGPEELGVEFLIRRIEQEKIEEVIIATSPNLEGETTLMCITELLGKLPVKISRLPYGLQMGTELEFADSATLKRSFDNRLKI